MILKHLTRKARDERCSATWIVELSCLPVLLIGKLIRLLCLCSGPARATIWWATLLPYPARSCPTLRPSRPPETQGKPPEREPHSRPSLNPGPCHGHPGCHQVHKLGVLHTPAIIARFPGHPHVCSLGSMSNSCALTGLLMCTPAECALPSSCPAASAPPLPSTHLAAPAHCQIQRAIFAYWM